MTITKQTTNYTISAENEKLKLEGTFSINLNNQIENYNATLDANGNIIGNANYSEYNGNVNYNYNVQPDYKTAVITLMDETITQIKLELIK